MKFLVQRQLPDREGAGSPLPKVNWPMVITLKDGPVCVSIVDEPCHSWHDSACQCGACRGPLAADWAARFLP